MNAKLTPQSHTIFQRIAQSDRFAIKECMSIYGNFVWRTVKKLSLSDKDAELMVENVFRDIWQYAERYDLAKLSENDFILMLIRRRMRQQNIH